MIENDDALWSLGFRVWLQSFGKDLEDDDAFWSESLAAALFRV